MWNIISPIQHWPINERLCILYEDLLDETNVISHSKESESFQAFFTLSISGLFVHKAGLGPLYQPITLKLKTVPAHHFEIGNMNQLNLLPSLLFPQLADRT